MVFAGKAGLHENSCTLVTVHGAVQIITLFIHIILAISRCPENNGHIKGLRPDNWRNGIIKNSNSLLQYAWQCHLKGFPMPLGRLRQLFCQKLIQK